MNWMSLLGLDAWQQRVQAALDEGGQSARDRLQLASLELAQEKKRWQTLAMLGVAALVLGIVALLMLSFALLVHFWDTPQRVVVAWVLAGVWLFAWAVVVYGLVSAARQSRPLLALTRYELQRDWQEWRQRKQSPFASSKDAARH